MSKVMMDWMWSKKKFSRRQIGIYYTDKDLECKYKGGRDISIGELI